MDLGGLVLRRAMKVVIAGAMVVMSAAPARAQVSILGLQVEEIRLDLVKAQFGDGYTLLDASLPGTFAIGIYMNDQVAFEPRVNILSLKVGDQDAETATSFGLYLPIYLAGDRGRSGLFVAPGIDYSRYDGSSTLDYGADIGLKSKVNDRMSMRVAALLRTGDTYADEINIGASFGFSIFLK